MLPIFRGPFVLLNCKSSLFWMQTRFRFCKHFLPNLACLLAYLNMKRKSEVKCWLRICVRLFATPWTGTHHTFLSMEFSWEEYWIKLPFPSPGAAPDPGIEKTQVSCIAGKLITIWATREAHFLKSVIFNFTCHLGYSTLIFGQTWFWIFLWWYCLLSCFGREFNWHLNWWAKNLNISSICILWLLFLWKTLTNI